MTRHASVHAAGVVIAPKAITEYAPLYKGAHDEIVTQWSMKEIERVRPAQDGLPRPQHADARSPTRWRKSSGRPARSWTFGTFRFDDAKTYQIFQEGPDVRDLPVREQRHARTSFAKPSRRRSRTSSR
mgnify:CR=1 FL=1